MDLVVLLTLWQSFLLYRPQFVHEEVQILGQCCYVVESLYIISMFKYGIKYHILEYLRTDGSLEGAHYS